MIRRSRLSRFDVLNGADMRPLRRRATALVLSAAQLGGFLQRTAPACAETVNSYVAPADGLVVDTADLLTASTQSYLDGLLARLEAETGFKVRVVCPPMGTQRSRESWSEYLRPIGRRLGVGEGSILIVVEQPAPKGSQQPGLLNIVYGSEVSVQLQYAFTKDYALRTAKSFGDPGYVSSRGTDGAVRDATENVIAALYDLLDRRKTTAAAPEEAIPLEMRKMVASLRDKAARSAPIPRVLRGLRNPLPPEQVSAILARHGS